MGSFLVLLCAIIIAIVFYKKVTISNKFIKIVASFGIWLISSINIYSKKFCIFIPFYISNSILLIFMAPITVCWI